jgi:lipoprotein-anchoring transpeptidase ErfK/SrfK
MISRIMAGIFAAAILSFGGLTAAPIAAEAQTPAQEQTQTPDQAQAPAQPQAEAPDQAQPQTKPKSRGNRRAAAAAAAETDATRNLDQQVAPSGSFFERLFGIGAAAVPRTVVPYTGRERPGTVIISTPERRLYLVLGGGQALRYGIGVGRIGFTWAGTTAVSMKREWPDWTPPEQMLQRRPDLPRHMAGGMANPLGARALYLGSSLYRIHGSNEPDTIGTAVSSGCFRLTNDDVIDLYNRVPVGTKVIVQQ